MSWNEGSDGSLTFDAPTFRPDRFYVYIAWGEDRQRPLYVGKGNRPFTRLGLHLALAKWADQARSFECHAFLSPEAALEAEIEAIHELNPIYNVIRSLPYRITAQRLLERIEANEANEAARERLLRKHAPKPKAARQEPIQSPWQRPGKRRRQVIMREDWWTPEQAAIVARVQKAGRP